MKTIYLIRHSAPFVEIENYSDYKNVSWSEYNKNMILSSIGEENAKKLTNIDELNNIDEVYSADSFRAIGTAKYIAEINNLKIKIDNRINERILGVEKISELKDNFTINSFNNKDLKVNNGESLNEVDKRFNKFLDEVLSNKSERIALFIHGILLMSYLQENTNFSFDGKNMKIVFNNKTIYDDKMKNPLIFKIEFNDEKQIINIENVNIQ